jgi:hypothetical protein
VESGSNVPAWSRTSRLCHQRVASTIYIYIYVTCSLRAAYSATLLIEQEVFPKRRCVKLYSITFPHHVKGGLAAGPPLLVIGREVDQFGAQVTPPLRHMPEWRALGLLYLLPLPECRRYK